MVPVYAMAPNAQDVKMMRAPVKLNLSGSQPQLLSRLPVVLEARELCLDRVKAPAHLFQLADHGIIAEGSPFRLCLSHEGARHHSRHHRQQREAPEQEEGRDDLAGG